MKRQTKHITHFTIHHIQRTLWDNTNWIDSWCSHSNRYSFLLVLLLLLHIIFIFSTWASYAIAIRNFITYYFVVALALSFLIFRIFNRSIGFLFVVTFFSVTACNSSLNKINGAVKKSPMPFILSSIWYELPWNERFPFGFYEILDAWFEHSKMSQCFRELMRSFIDWNQSSSV